MNTENLLIEVGTEELPPKSLKKLAESLAANFEQELEKLSLTFETINWMAAPRRLALTVTSLAGSQADKVIDKKGPAISAAFDTEGNPTKAAQGWAKSNGIDVSQAEKLETDKGAWLLHRAKVEGKPVTEIIPEALRQALAKLPIPKPMKWGAYKTQFIRPVHTVTVLFGSDVLEGEVLGINISNQLQGHRFHHPERVTITHANDYVDALLKAKVMVDYEQRKNVILEQVESITQEINAKAVIDDDLLDEVTSLVEWPVALVGEFEDRFLNVPSEALIYTMQDNQKYFPLTTVEGNLLSKFIFISNIESKNPAKVIEGNEKVVRPRLADAEFFFETDKKTSLEARLVSLESVLFEKQLGTLKEKSERISSLSTKIAKKIGANEAAAARAGLLSKADLMSEMVMEFTDIQGTMGRYYAINDGESVEVATAIEEQYYPKYSGAPVPSSDVGACVALADKLDSLAGIFGINKPPKSDKDPFALRRAAIGIIRIITEKKLDLDLVWLTDLAVSEYGNKLTNKNTLQQILDFFFARFRSWYQDQDISVDVIQAVLERKPTSPTDLNDRITAVQHFKSLEACDALAAANKRVSNILSKADIDLTDKEINTALFEQSYESKLFESINAQKSVVEPLISDGNYKDALSSLATLRDVTDEFFENVMVMSEDTDVRVNRLTLLTELQNLFLKTADISLLQ